ncbi:MAG: hypothetical protein KGH72_04555 [Candidatus Micrarchaeota archaeon]|nr:hypothetical protein [Candidatus Micrarchaeota archaeon]
MSVAARINERAELCRNTLRSNCIGTALYLVGMQSDDEFIGDHQGMLFRSLLSSLRRLDEPAVGCLVAWQWDHRPGMPYVYHMAVVTATEPLLATHRSGRNEPVYEQHTLSDIAKAYALHGRSYYLPDTAVVVPEMLRYDPYTD